MQLTALRAAADAERQGGSSEFVIRSVPTFVVLLALSASWGCAQALKIDVKEHADHADLYVAYYHPASVLLEKYGRGEDEMFEALNTAADPETVKLVWNSRYGGAISHYLALNGRIPEACLNGIVPISSSPDEAGGGTTTFHCK